MADVLGIGTSALLSLQRAIATTGQNIANVNTEGYSRQSVEFTARTPRNVGVGFIGSGVQIRNIERSFDQFLTDDLRDRTASAAGASTLADLTGRINTLLASSDTGLGPVLDNFFAAVQDVANNPGSIPERQVLIGQGQVLAERFSFLDERLSAFDREVNQRLTDSVSQINALAQNIANLNEQIVDARQTGFEPNDLLDTRDQVVLELAELVGVTTVEQDDGALNIFIGNGQSLVIGNSASQLEAFSDPNNVSRTNVGIAGVSNPTDIGRFLSGGELGAALQFRNSVVDPARAQLGLIAVGITETFNAQQALGLDLNGDLGGDFFQSIEPTVAGAAQNTGAGIITASIDDVSQLTGASYTISFDGTDYTITNNDTNASQTGAGPNFTVDGVAISVGTAPAAGDSFLIEPVTTAAGLFSVELSDPRLIAAASPVRSSASIANAGSGELENLSVNGTAGLPLAGTVTLTFNPDALGAGIPGFDVVGIGGGPIAFDPSTDSGGVSATLGDFSFELSGVPVDGDSFTIQNNLDGSGDNRNALALAGIQREPNLLGGTASFQDAYATIVGDVAVRGQQASSLASTESALLDQARAARNGAQGVNLDEEAANLLRYQQAYSAAAQVIAVADEVFQVLLNATSR